MISFNPQSQSSSGLINENNCTESEQPSIQKSSPREGILHSCITKIGQYLVEGSKKLTQVFVRPSKLALDDLTKAIGTSTLFRRTSYLTEMLPFFSLYNYEDALSLGTFNKYTEQAILGYWERKLTSFKQVCTLYKEKKLAQGESEEEINKELSRVIGEAEQIAETDVEKAVDVLRNIEYLQSLFKLDVNCLRFDQLSTIADMRFRIEYLFKNPPPIAIPLKDACRIFFEKNKNAEYPDIYVKKFFCFMKLLEMTPPQ